MEETAQQAPEPMEVGPIDMLIGLVVSREIDPWNIDIVELTSKYLDRIRQLQELDLRLSGKTILVASILLRMQSEDLFRVPEKKEEEEPDDEEELDVDLKPILPPLRRSSGKITLPQLMEALLQALEETERKRTLKPRKRREEKHVVRIDEHRLNIEEEVKKLQFRIKDMADEMGTIAFSDLLDDNLPLTIARTLLYILYLETKGKIDIVQHELFGEIYINM